MHRSASLLVLALLACQDNGVTVYNTAPVVSIDEGLDGATFRPESTIDLTGVARDNQQDPSTLLVTWTSSIDGELGESEPDSEGLVRFSTASLSAGVHSITLKAIDNAGESGTDVVTIDVGYGGEVVGAPTVTIDGPLNGEEFGGGEIITLVGYVEDEEQPQETLSLSLVSSREGLLWEGAPTSRGMVFIDIPDDALGVPELREGQHVLTLSAVDDDGNEGTASVTITVLEDGRPVVNITNPSDNARYLTSESITFNGSVSDDVSDNDAMTVEWSSSIDGVFASGSPDSSGVSRASAFLSEGNHVIELTAWDEDGNDGSASIAVTIIDPLNQDDDGDGVTENQGDCDDSDPFTYAGAAYNDSNSDCMTDVDGDGYGDDNPASGVVAGSDCDDGDSGVHPGAAEVCDSIDNDCDGSINEDLDTHQSEPNDSQSAAFDVGGLNTSWWPWSGGATTINGLMFPEASDEDWFAFEADDVIVLDDLDIDVTVSGLPAVGSYTLDMWNTDEGGVHESVSGTGTLTVSWTDSFGSFDSYEDWVISVSTNSWDPQACLSTYEVEIRISQ